MKVVDKKEWLQTAKIPERVRLVNLDMRALLNFGTIAGPRDTSIAGATKRRSQERD